MVNPEEAVAALTGAGYAWRIISDGAGEAAWNMAVDEALLDAVAANMSPPTLRLYGWRYPAITLGRFQNVDRTMDVVACRAHKIPLIRRITGGRGILHGADLTVSIAAPQSALGPDNRSLSTLEIYQHTAGWFVSALAGMGVVAQPGDCCRVRGQEHYGNCFDIVSRADVVEKSSGRKVLGSALYRRGEYVLQQVSIPLDSRSTEDRATEILKRVFRRGGDRPSGDVGSAEPGPLDAKRLRECIIQELWSLYGNVDCGGRLTGQERSVAELLAHSRYGQDAWNVDGVSSDRGRN